MSEDKEAFLKRVRERQEEISDQDRESTFAMVTANTALIYANGIATSNPQARSAARKLILGSILEQFDDKTEDTGTPGSGGGGGS